MVSTLGGVDFYQYPSDGGYLTLDVKYRAAFGSVIGALFTFTVVATFVWGGLAMALRTMLSDDEDAIDLTKADAPPESVVIQESGD